MISAEKSSSFAQNENCPAVPLYRLYNPAADDHLYTTDLAERDAMLAVGNYHSEGIAGWICLAKQPGTAPLYRLYDGTDHFYTAGAQERDRAMTTGYRNEGVIGFVFTRRSAVTVPLYRLQHPQTGNHFYTVSEAERETACKQAGYLREGITGFIYGACPTPAGRNDRTL